MGEAAASSPLVAVCSGGNFSNHLQSQNGYTSVTLQGILLPFTMCVLRVSMFSSLLEERRQGAEGVFPLPTSSPLFSCCKVLVVIDSSAHWEERRALKDVFIIVCPPPAMHGYMSNVYMFHHVCMFNTW